MLLLVLGGVSIAMLRPSLLTLWFIGCTIRLSSFFPTIISIVWHKPATNAYALATMLGLGIGGSLFALGILRQDMLLRSAGMLATITLSGGVLAFSFLYEFLRNIRPRSLVAAR